MKTVKAIAKAVIAGAVGGALSGALIIIIPEHGYDPVAPVAAIFGSLFGILAFPICYFAIVRDVPMWLVIIFAVPATIAGQVGFLQYMRNYVVPGDSFLFIFFAGGFVGLLLTCIVLRIIYSLRRVRSVANSIGRGGRP